MTDSKLHLRGKGVTPVREVIAHLEEDKARTIAEREGGREGEEEGSDSSSSSR